MFAYFNNDAQGFALQNALELTALLADDRPDSPPGEEVPA